MIDNEEVTILMSVYNTPIEQLKRSIDSILNQTYKEFEFLIIDDGADSECIEFIKTYKDNRINLIHNEKNLGLERSLNKGLNIARGQYIVRMDSDDISYLDRIEKQINFIKQNPEYTIVGTRAELINEKGIYGQSQSKGIIKKENFIFGTPFIHPSLIIKKEDLLKVGGYPLYKRCEDYAMEMELYSNGYKGYIMDEILIQYRMDNESYRRKKFKDRFTEVKLRFKYFKKMNISLYKYFFVLKPIIAGIVPKKVIKNYHRKKFNIR